MPHPPAGATDRVHGAARWEGAGVRQRPSSQVPHRRVRFGCGGSCVSFNGPRSAPRPTSLKAAVLFEVAKRIATRQAAGQLGLSDQAHDHNITQPAATRAALGTASRVRPEPLKPGLPDTSRRLRCVSAESVCRYPSNQYQEPARKPPLRVFRFAAGRFTASMALLLILSFSRADLLSTSGSPPTLWLR